MRSSLRAASPHCCWNCVPSPAWHGWTHAKAIPYVVWAAGRRPFPLLGLRAWGGRFQLIMRLLNREIGSFVGEVGRAEPKTESGPDFCRISRSLSPISSMACSLAVHEVDWVAQPALAQHVIANHRALAAMGAAINGTVAVGLLADPYAVGDFGNDGAADRAMGANILAPRDRRGRGRRLSSLGAADVAERQRAERRQAPRGEARALQETAPIQAAFRLALNRGDERPAVAGGAVSSS
jgi:hypothetical protein